MVDNWYPKNLVSSPDLGLVLVVLLWEYCSLFLPLLIILMVLPLIFWYPLDRDDISYLLRVSGNMQCSSQLCYFCFYLFIILKLIINGRWETIHLLDYTFQLLSLMASLSLMSWLILDCCITNSLKEGCFIKLPVFIPWPLCCYL